MSIKQLVKQLTSDKKVTNRFTFKQLVDRLSDTERHEILPHASNKQIVRYLTNGVYWCQPTCLLDVLAVHEKGCPSWLTKFDPENYFGGISYQLLKLGYTDDEFPPYHKKLAAFYYDNTTHLSLERCLRLVRLVDRLCMNCPVTSPLRNALKDSTTTLADVKLLIDNGADINDDFASRINQLINTEFKRNPSLEELKYLDDPIYLYKLAEVIDMPERNDILNYFISLGVDVNNKYYPPLITAVKHNLVDFAIILLAHGANTNVTDEHKLTPMDYARANNNPDMMAALSAYSNNVK